MRNTAVTWCKLRWNVKPKLGPYRTTFQFHQDAINSFRVIWPSPLSSECILRVGHKPWIKRCRRSNKHATAGSWIGDFLLQRVLSSPQDSTNRLICFPMRFFWYTHSRVNVKGSELKQQTTKHERWRRQAARNSNKPQCHTASDDNLPSYRQQQAAITNWPRSPKGCGDHSWWSKALNAYKLL